LKYTTNLKQIRKNKGLTQEEVARRAEIAFSTYVYIEQGKSKPNIITALRIAKALNENLDRLFLLIHE
jgi:DNA-binding XRE family transcriptional regulator